MRVRFERITCNCNLELCEMKMCNVKFKSRNVTNLNLVIAIKKELPQLQLTMKSFYKFSNNEYRPMLVNTNYDQCAIQNGNGSSPFYTLLLKILVNTTNFYQKCPFLPGEYYIKDFNL